MSRHWNFNVLSYMQFSAAVAIKNILNKPGGSLKRDLVFTESTFDNLNVKK